MKTKEQVKKEVSDPIYFITKILGVKYLTPEQILIINSVKENKLTGVKAAHSVGKTFIAACLCLWFLVTNANSIVVTTAPTGKQVRNLLWAEINNLFNKSRIDLGGKINQTEYKINAKWFAVGISVEPGKESDSAITMQGYHARKILVIPDEAFGIHKNIWEAIDGITNSEGAKVFAIGNPVSVSNGFAQRLKEKGWNVLTLSALNHPNVIEKKEIVPGAVSYDWVKEKVFKWCDEVTEHDKSNHTFEFEGKIYRPNSLFCWKVLGEFPGTATDTLIDYNSILEAMEREPIRSDVVHIALDPARFGNDKSLFDILKDGKHTFDSFYHFDVAKLTGAAVKKLHDYKPSKFAVDCIGIGAGVHDNTKELKEEKRFDFDFDLVEFQSSFEPTDTDETIQFVNLRAQAYWYLRTDINTMSIEYDEELLEGLSSIKYFFNAKGKVQIESKDDFKKRMGRSPDKEDSLVMCNYLKYQTETEYSIRILSR